MALEHEVHRLQAQTNPHFRFNALNAVVACKDNPEDVARLTQGLADFLRSSLRDSRLANRPRLTSESGLPSNQSTRLLAGRLPAADEADRRCPELVAGTCQ